MAKKTVEQLVLELSLDNKQFNAKLMQSMRDTERQTSRGAKAIGGLSQSLKRMASTAKGAIAAYAGVAGARALGAYVRSSLDAMDKTDKLAKRLGVSTDFIQEMGYAAEVSGVNLETLAMSMQRYIRRASDASQGIGVEVVRAMEELGLTVRNTAGEFKSAEVLFTESLEAVAGADASRRLALAQKLYDSEGVAVVQLADSFRELVREARDLGVVIDFETIQKGVRAKDELTKLSSIVSGELADAVVDIAPLLVKMGEGLGWVADAASDLFRNFQSLEDMSISGLREEILEAQGEIANFQQRYIELRRSGLTATDPQVQQQRSMAEDRMSSVRQMQAELARKEAARAARTRSMSRSGGTNMAFGEGSLRGTPGEATGAVGEATVAKAEWLKAWEAIQERGLSAEEKMRAQLESFGEEVPEGVREQWEAAIESMGEAGSSVWDEMGEGMVDTFSGALAQMLIEGEFTFAELGKAFASEILSQFIGLGVNKVIGGITASIGQSAGGGFIAPGVPRIVGEMGPEIFIPKSGGNVIPASHTSAAMMGSSGGGVSIVVNNNARTAEASVFESPGGGDQMRRFEIMVEDITSKSMTGGRLGETTRQTFNLQRYGAPAGAV